MPGSLASAWRAAAPVVALAKPAAVAADAAATTTVSAVTAKASRYPATCRMAAGSLGMSTAILRASGQLTCLRRYGTKRDVVKPVT